MKHAIWTPDGVKGPTNLTRVEVSGQHMGAFRDFAAFGRYYGLGLHCAKCGQDLVGKNADTDRVQAVICGCREFIGPNTAQQVIQ